MKDNIFAHWFKELCSLVFIQAIQAFIFAIVMSLIISVMTPANTEGVDRTDFVAATGVIAVIALASLSKIEELVKKIFGVQSSITDPGMRGGMKSLATTMMAANLAKGVLDNAGKVAGGIGGTVVAGRKMNQARAGLARKLGTGGPGGTQETLPNGSNAANGTSTGVTSEQYLDAAKQAKANGDMDGYRKNLNIAAGALKAEKTSATGAVSGKKSDLSKAYDEYNNKMNELKSQRRKSLYKIASGITESAGAAVGGTAGLMAGAAIGEGKEMLNYGLAGMGIGDKLGAVPTKMTEAGHNMVSEVGNVMKERQNLVKAVENMNDDARQAIKETSKLRTKYSKARAELDKQMQNFDISDL